MNIHIAPDQPVLIAGPTASGKSALALEIACAQGGVIVNADALQVFDGWQVLTARPDQQDLARAPHALYGHVPFDKPYSVGDWLRDMTPLLSGERPIIVGGTGLYFSALTEGLAEIPPTPATIRAQADGLSHSALLDALDADTQHRIDTQNRARVQRAWEVLQTTGESILTWQARTPPPLLDLTGAVPLVLDAPKEWLTPRIETRFEQMIANGALDEARAILPSWDPKSPAAKAIGAPELIAHLQGRISLEDACELATISTRQYAKRQRTWFRKRMKSWMPIHMPSTDLSTAFTFTT